MKTLPDPALQPSVRKLSREEKAEIAERIAAELARKQSRGEPMIPLSVERKRGAVAGTFWGNAWCERMEACSDYRDRLPLGRSRLRAGAVYDLAITPREVFAYVAGEELYEVLVRIEPLRQDQRDAVERACGGRIGSVLDLLSGNLSETVVQALIDPAHGLIPGPDEIRFQCDCPDHAGLCVHGAAVLYAVGVRLDLEPALLFVLREVDKAALVSGVVGVMGQTAAGPEAGELGLNLEDLSSLFGIEVEEDAT